MSPALLSVLRTLWTSVVSHYMLTITSKYAIIRDAVHVIFILSSCSPLESMVML
jgi:hypothetical protein